jgi:AraC-like DNA-binding protein
MPPAPMIDMSQFVPFLDLLSRTGAPIEKILDGAKIPRSILDDPRGFVPAVQAWAFADLSADSLGAPDLGWQVSNRAPLKRMGTWAAHVARAHTLREAIEALTFWYPKEVPLVRTGLSDGGAHAWLWRVRLADLDRDRGAELVEQFTVNRLIKVVRLAGGEDWLPTHVKLETRRGVSRLASNALSEARIEFNQPCIAIAVPRELLDRSVIRHAPLASMVEQEARPQEPGTAFTQVLSHLLKPLVGETPVSLDLAAQLAGTSARTVRRRLKEEGSGWRTLHDDLLVHASLPMLIEPTTPIAEIALRLGYSDHAHFTRAFKRWTGQAPSELRQRHAAERD